MSWAALVAMTVSDVLAGSGDCVRSSAWAGGRVFLGEVSHFGVSRPPNDTACRGEFAGRRWGGSGGGVFTGAAPAGLRAHRRSLPGAVRRGRSRRDP